MIGPNNPPVAAGDAYQVDEDTLLARGAPGVLLNDTDIDGDTLTAVQVSGPSKGTLTLNADGSFTYQPNANTNGSDSFTYRASDGSSAGNVATVSITVNAVNDPPQANDQAVTADEDTALRITLSATDVDSGSLTYSVVAGPAHGTLTGAPPNVVYTPTANFNGTDSFTFAATDRSLESNTATVTIDVRAVNDAPVAVNDSYQLPVPGSPLTVTAPGVLGNDTDVDGDRLTAVVVAGPSSGTVTVNADGSFTYTPGQSVSAPDSFTYRATDGKGGVSNVAAVRLTGYVLVGIQNVPPAAIVKAKAGSAVPMKWQFRDGSLVVDSAGVHHRVTVQSTATPPPPPYTVSDTDPGSSSFRYDSATRTWSFNLQLKDSGGVPYPTGEYWVTITPTTPGYLSSGPFKLTVTK